MNIKFKENILFVTQMSPANQVGGATVVMANLISALATNNYTVCYFNYFKPLYFGEKKPKNFVRVIPNYHPVQLIKRINSGMGLQYEINKVKNIVEKKNIKLIIGVFPTFKSLYIANEVANKCRIKFMPYFHDILSESLVHTDLCEQALSLEKQIFSDNHKILTMSQGMTDHYHEKYNVTTFPLEHSYPEVIQKEIKRKRDKTIFWGGSIQNFNKKSFFRIIDGSVLSNIKMEVTNLQSAAGMGINVELVNNFYPQRKDYLKALTNKGVLTLAIDWSDESPLGSSELSTIFPTRVIEYFASGSPILVHCPEHYFLAKFFKEHKCGLIIDQRDTQQLSEGITFLMSDSDEVIQMQENALQIANYFSLERISKLFYSYVKTNF